MDSVARWFKKNKVKLDEYLVAKKPNCSPAPAWWLQLLVISNFAACATVTFKGLQGHSVTVSMQRNHLAYLQTVFLRTVGGGGPLTEFEAASLDNPLWVLSECRSFSASLFKVKEFIMNLGSFADAKLQQVDEENIEKLVKDVAILDVRVVGGISGIVAERDTANDCDQPLPPALPHQLVTISRSDLCCIIRTHRERLATAG